jgi:hypothetical protein
MLEIKNRMTILEDFLKGKSTGHLVTDEEFCFLQIRKIIELVILSSIAPNHDAYRIARAEMERDYRKDWNAEHILRDLKRINSGFYPMPVVQEQNGENKFHYENKENGFLTERELLNAYRKCGAALHANNPFSNRGKRKGSSEFIKSTFEGIWSLLDIHFIKIYSDPNTVWLIHMMDPRSHEVYIAEAKKKDPTSR